MGCLLPAEVSTELRFRALEQELVYLSVAASGPPAPRPLQGWVLPTEWLLFGQDMLQGALAIPQTCGLIPKHTSLAAVMLALSCPAVTSRLFEYAVALLAHLSTAWLHSSIVRCALRNACLLLMSESDFNCFICI